MLALDIHETFDSENDEQKTGMRLRETILEKGAGDVAKELYRRFQVKFNAVLYHLSSYR